MAANPQLAKTDFGINYDGVRVRIARGQVIDMPVGSVLANATAFIPWNSGTTSGTLSSNVVALTSQQTTPGGSDSIGPVMENAVGGGQEPYSFGQVG